MSNIGTKALKNTIYAEIATFNGTIWDEFIEQHLHQGIKKLK